VDAYVVEKVRDAVRASGGSRSAAQRLLVEWAQRDQRLLLGLTRGVLPALAGSVVARATKGRGAVGAGVARAGAGPAAGAPSAARPSAQPPPSVAQALAALVGDDAPRFGMGASFGGPVPPPSRAEGHAKALRAFAAAQARRRFP
jgi:hypothetical protein